MSTRGAVPHAISVALVTRNRPRSLDRCLASWRRQTIAPFEIVVSDDSDPADAAATAAVAAHFDCVYTRGPRRGLYANRNHASLACGGTHILSADDDHTHPSDYVATIASLIEVDPRRIWIFSERHPGDVDSRLQCPAELHRSGNGCAPADPFRCAAIADGASVYPREVFDRGLRYDDTYAFGALWYLWGKLLAARGWHITFSNRTFVWHHWHPDGCTPDDGRADDPGQVELQLLARTYVQFANALWIERSVAQLGWACVYLARRIAWPDSTLGYRVSRRLPPLAAGRAVARVWEARHRYRSARM